MFEVYHRAPKKVGGGLSLSRSMRFVIQKQLKPSGPVVSFGGFSNWHIYDLNQVIELGLSLPTLPCCYVIFSGGQLIYIGSTENLHYRMMICHFRNGGKFNRFLSGGVVVKAKFPHRFGEWLMIEARLVSRLSPPLNTRFKE
jgi:hypothetical protein